MDHQLGDLGPVAAVGLVGEGDAHGAGDPSGVERDPDGVAARPDLAGEPAPPAGRAGTVQIREEAERGAAPHGLHEQLRQPVRMAEEPGGVQTQSARPGDRPGTALLGSRGRHGSTTTSAYRTASSPRQRKRDAPHSR
ncbi:hypothetical protein SALBM135S_02785 [Streptomyces alboniger]